MSELLEMRNVSKAFPGVKALDDVRFSSRAGEIHALMGENGAGKSTLIKVLTGVYPKDDGEIVFTGKQISPCSSAEAEKAGISTVYQEVNLVPTLSVAENIMLGRQPSQGGLIRWGQLRRQAKDALARLGLEDIDVTRPMGTYSIAIQQMTAIARALDVDAKLLILDEPTASLDDREVDELFSLMRNLKKQGMGLIFVTHFIDQVYSVCDRITVLRNGKLAGEWPIDELPHLKLVSEMLGKDMHDVEQLEKKHVQVLATGEPYLSLSGAGRKGAVKPIDMEIRKGECVGLAGLLGSGRTEIARMIFGVDPSDEGSMSIKGETVLKLTHPRQAVKRKMAFLTEDRKTEGIIPGLSVRENIILALQGKMGMLNRLSHSKQSEIASHYISSLKIKTPTAETPVSSLSGGNQQKVLIARWLATQPEFIIFDEPTRGIDIGAKSEVERIVAELRDQGVSILFISSEIEELVRNTQRIIVLRDRKKIAELDGTTAQTQDVMHAIAGTDEVTGE